MPPWRTLQVRSTARVDLLDITDQVAATLDAGADGAIVVFTPHTTAALLLNEHEDNLREDIRAWLERLAPAGSGYAHNRLDDNADAHLRAIALGSSVVVPVESGRLEVGRWQRIFFVELDGPRTRQVRVRLLG